MALGTPVAAATAYNSAAGTTTVAPAYPSGILATDVVLLFVGQKPSTANSGTVTTPTGWTLRDELTAAGGYGTTLGADTGNTNLRVYSWNTPVAGQTGTLSVTLGTNNISWAFMVRIPTGGGAISYGSADGQRTTQPTSPMSIALTNGATATNFQSGDLAIWAMCIPTDVTTPGQFSAQSITASGATFGTATELNEPDSGTNNDIGGYSAYASVSSGSSTAAPTVTATLTGTLTNVRGPVVLLRVREAPVAQDLTPDLFTNTQAFHNPTVVQEQFLTPALFTNGATFFSPDVTQPAGTQDLAPQLYTNGQTFYAPAVTATRDLTAARYDNAQAFYPPTLTSSVALIAARFENTSLFFAPAVTQAGGPQSVTPDLYSNGAAFYAPALSLTLAPARHDNGSVIHAPSAAAVYHLTPGLAANASAFYPAAVANVGAAGQALTFDDYVASGYVDPEYVTWTASFGANQVFAPTVGTSGVEPAARHEIDIIDFEPKLWWQRRPKAIPEPVAKEKLKKAAKVIRQVAEQAAEQGTEPTKKDLRQAIEPLEMPGFDYLALYQQVSLLVSLERQRDAEEQARQLAQAVILAAQQRAQDDEDELILLLAA